MKIASHNLNHRRFNLKLKKAQFSLQDDEMRKGAAMWAGIFVAIGVASFLASLVQQACFALMGAKLSRRVRGLTFAALMRQVSALSVSPCRSSEYASQRAAHSVQFLSAGVQQLLGAGCQRQRAPPGAAQRQGTDLRLVPLCRRSWRGSTRRSTPAAPSQPAWPPMPRPSAAPWCASLPNPRIDTKPYHIHGVLFVVRSLSLA